MRRASLTSTLMPTPTQCSWLLCVSICALSLFIAGCGGSDDGGDKKKSDPGRSFKMPEPETVVTVTPVLQGSITSYQVASGRLAPLSQAPVFARVGELCEEVRVDVGDYVREGDVLARLRSEPFDIAKRKAEASVAESKERVREARVELDKKIEDMLRMLRVSFEDSNRDDEIQTVYDGFEKQVEDARSAWLNAYAAQRLLPESKRPPLGAVLGEEAVRAQKTYDDLVQKLIMLLFENSSFTKTSVFTRDEIMTARVELERAEAAWAVSKTNLKRVLADLDTAQIDSEATIVTSPISGVIIARMVEPFELITKDMQIFVVAELDEMKLELRLPESAAGLDRPDLENFKTPAVILSTSAIQPERAGELRVRFLAYLDMLSPVIDPEEGVVHARVKTLRKVDPDDTESKGYWDSLYRNLVQQLPSDEREAVINTMRGDYQERLRPGMWVEARIVESSVPDAYYISSGSVVNSTVYLVSKPEVKASDNGGEKAQGDRRDGKGSGGGRGGKGRSGDKGDGAPKLIAKEVDIGVLIGMRNDSQTQLVFEGVEDAPFGPDDYIVFRGIEYLKDESPIKVKDPSDTFKKKFGYKDPKSESKSRDKAKNDESKVEKPGDAGKPAGS